MDNASFEIGANWGTSPHRLLRDIEQEFDARAQVEALLRRYERAVAARYWAGLASLFAEDATFLPMTGGVVEGSRAIQGFYEQSGQTALKVEPARTRLIRKDLILDVGTFIVLVAEEAGTLQVRGGYLILAENAAGEMQIRSLATFPMREPANRQGRSAGAPRSPSFIRPRPLLQDRR